MRSDVLGLANSDSIGHPSFDYIRQIPCVSVECMAHE